MLFQFSRRTRNTLVIIDLSLQCKIVRKIILGVTENYLEVSVVISCIHKEKSLLRTSLPT